MLPDPIYLGNPDGNVRQAIMVAGNDLFTFGLPVDLLRLTSTASGTTVRQAQGENLTCTIAHTPSKENGVVPTRRSVIRLDRTGTDTSLERPFKASAYLVLTTPLSEDWTTDDQTKLAVQLLAFLLFGEADLSDNKPTGEDKSFLTRFVGGEP